VTKKGKVFLTIVILIVGFMLIRQIFLLKPVGEVQTLWEKWTQGDIIKRRKEAEKAYQKSMEELRKLKKAREQIERIHKGR